MANNKKPLPQVHTKRHRLEIMFAEMENEYSTHRSYHRDLLDYVNPQRGRFTVTDAGKGTRKNQRIVNPVAADALTVLKAGMVATITNPASQWVRLSVEDKELAEIGAVKEWLGDTSKTLHDIFLKSNLYRNLPIVYGDMAVVAVGALLVEEDSEDVIRTYPIPCGSFYIDVDAKGKVNHYAREFRYNVQQVVEKFSTPEGEEFVVDNIDWSKFSLKVKNLYEKGQHTAWVDVVHMIVPNTEYDPSKLDAKYKKFASVYYERGSSGLISGSDNRHTDATLDPNVFLRESGLDHFNILAPRWEVTGEDAWGTNCPAMKAHGSSRAVQTMEKRKAQATEQKVNPTLLFPTSLKKKKTSVLPGAKVYVDDVALAKGGVRRLYEVDFKTGELREDIRDVEAWINASFHKDAFAPISSTPIQGTPPSVAEVNARISESLIKISGTGQNIQDDLLEPLVDITFAHANNQGKIKEAPEELEGITLKVEFIGVMAQAQKAIALGSLREFTDFALAVANIEPTALDKVDTDQLIDEYHDGSGVSTKVLVQDEEVLEKRLDRQEAQQAQAQQEQMMNMAKSAKDLSQADMTGDNALTALTEGAEQQI